jgi:GH25 family lysozyme M1 (1,4-beta-N-acetylmuramidase)
MPSNDPLKGIDISVYQGSPDFNKLKGKVDFIFTKVTEGTDYINAQFKNCQEQCRKLGIPLGYYHFGKPDLGNKAVDEAKYFVKTIGEIKPGEILALDIEVPYKELAKWSKEFLDTLSGLLGGYKPLIYLNLNQITNNNWKPIVDANYGLWIAYYHQNLPDNLPWKTVAFHQYTSSGNIDGIKGNVDLNYFYGSKEALVKYGYKGVQENTTTPENKELKVALEKIKSLEKEVNYQEIEKEKYKKRSREQEKEIEKLTNNWNECKKALDRVEDKKNELTLANAKLNNTIEDKEKEITHMKDSETQMLDNVTTLTDELKRLTDQKFTIPECLKFLQKAIKEVLPHAGSNNKTIK